MSADGTDTTEMPTPLAASVRDRDVIALAKMVFADLETCMPPEIPAAVRFSVPDVVRAWRDKGTPIPEHHANEFGPWFIALKARNTAIEEAKRRLRSTMWAEVTLRSDPDPEWSRTLGAFHREQWRIALVSADSVAREEQIIDAVKRLGWSKP
jgi:hypothetical protein